MTIRTRQMIAPLALCAAGLVLLVLSGCRKEREPELPANSPAVYMKDPAFRQALAEKRRELRAIAAERQPLADRMEELVRAHKENLAELQKVPEWNDLHKRVVALNRKYAEVRQRQLAVVQRRLASPAQEKGQKISK